jgi:hypothetical protein
VVIGIKIIAVQKNCHDTAGSNLNASSIFANVLAVCFVGVPTIGGGAVFAIEVHHKTI